MIAADRWKALALVVVLTTTVSACGGGGGGGGGGGPTSPPPPARMMSWSADATPGTQTVYLNISNVSNPDEFVLQIKVNDVTDLYGVALDVVYPSGSLDFQAAGTVEGPILPAGGAFATELQVVEQPPGTIVIGYSRLGDVSGRNGNGLLLSLRFTTTANGSSDLSIESSQAIASDGAPVATTWLGGTVQVQR